MNWGCSTSIYVIQRRTHPPRGDLLPLSSVFQLLYCTESNPCSKPCLLVADLDLRATTAARVEDVGLRMAIRGFWADILHKASNID